MQCSRLKMMSLQHSQQGSNFTIPGVFKKGRKTMLVGVQHNDVSMLERGLNELW